MKQVFVDTSGWCALADKADKDHARALQFRDEIVHKRKFVTSNYILDELYTLLLMNIGFQPLTEHPPPASNFKLQIFFLSAERFPFAVPSAANGKSVIPELSACPVESLPYSVFIL